MNKIILIGLFLIVTSFTIISQSYYNSIFNKSMTNFSGTLEVKDGFTYLRTENDFYKLNVPKHEKFTINTVPDHGTLKLNILGKIMDSPINQIYIYKINISGYSLYSIDQLFFLLMPFSNFME